MTTSPRHLVVDGSNIATEGRSLPSLKQLDEAVRAVLAERAFDSMTVIVDATFAHRIDKSEREEFEAAIEAGEMLMPPAGVVGRGDAFILQVAGKANAAVLSNDSFQEFQDEHPWLFDEGRLVGGKPIEHIGWVFVDRTPVRGPQTRRGRRRVPRREGATPTSSGEVLGPPPVPSAPPPSARRSRKTAKTADNGRATKKPTGNKPATEKAAPGNGTPPGGRAREPLNQPLDFLAFVKTHGLGDEAQGVVDQFSSHGCYVLVDKALCYLPSKNMGDPPPAKARDVVNKGDTVRVRVLSFDKDHRGINVELLSVKTLATHPESTDENVRYHPGGASRSLGSGPDPSSPTVSPRSADDVVTKKATAKKAPAKKAPAKKAAAKKAPAKKAAAKKAPAKKAAAKKR